MHEIIRDVEFNLSILLLEIPIYVRFEKLNYANNPYGDFIFILFSR